MWSRVARIIILASDQKSCLNQFKWTKEFIGLNPVLSFGLGHSLIYEFRECHWDTVCLLLYLLCFSPFMYWLYFKVRWLEQLQASHAYDLKSIEQITFLPQKSNYRSQVFSLALTGFCSQLWPITVARGMGSANWGKGQSHLNIMIS